jgi:Transcriptional regulators
MNDQPPLTDPADSGPGLERAIPTSRDVAKLAGVSQSSVCRVFDKKWADKISPKLEKRVREAAQALGYSPNALARGLTAQRSGIVGLVISEDFNDFYYDIMRRMTNELQMLGIRVMLFNASPHRNIDHVIRQLQEYRVDGILFTAASLSSKVSPLQCEVPLVLVNVYTDTPFCSSVICDNFGGSKEMASYLYECGGRDFLYVSAENSRYYDVSDRKSGFLAGLREKGITECRIERGDYSYESGKEIGRRLFCGSKRPDTIFSCGSRMAFGIMDVARYEFGIRIPEDLSVAGYDDLVMTDLDAYGLTCVQQPSQALAKTAVRSSVCGIISGTHRD